MVNNLQPPSNSKMKIGKLAYIIFAVNGILLLLPLTLWLTWDEKHAPETAAFQQTYNWGMWRWTRPTGKVEPDMEYYDANVPPEIRAGIWLRFDDSHNLLFKHNYATDVFVYNAQAKYIKQATPQDWDSAGGQTTVCEAQNAPEFNRELVYATGYSYRYKLHDKIIETYGKYTLSAGESPTRRYGALLSAAGPLREAFGFGWFIGRDAEVHGRRYVQIIELDDSKQPEFFGDPVRLSNSVDNSQLHLCWSPDEKYIIAYNKGFDHLSVVETHLAEQ